MEATEYGKVTIEAGHTHRANIGYGPEGPAARGVFDRLADVVTLYGPAAGRWGPESATTPIIDISEWVHDVDFAVLKAAGVKAVVAKCSQGSNYINPKFAKWCQGAYDVDLPFMAYHVYVPGIVDNKPGNTALQIANMKKALENKLVHALWIDNEIWKMPNGKPYSPYWLENWCKDLIDTSINTFPKIKRIGMYSAMWFINAYAPNITNWAGNYPLWLAQYPYGPDTVVTSWEDLAARWYPPQDVKVVTPGNASWTMWQFSGDKFKLPGILANDKGDLSAVDLNLVPMPVAQFYKWLGYVPRGTTGPGEPPPVVIPPPATGDMAAVLAKLDQLELELMQVKGEVTKIGGHFK